MPRKPRPNTSQPSIFIELVSSDKVTFKISLKAVEKVKAVDSVFSHLNVGPEEQASKKEPIPLENVSSDLLRKIIEWCEHHKEDTPDEIEKTEMLGIQPWDEQFLKAFNLLGLYELIKATDYLDIKELMGYACKEVAQKVKGYSPDQMKQFFEFADEDDEESEEDDDGAVEKRMLEMRIGD